jgi:hypothetical protein
MTALQTPVTATSGHAPPQSTRTEDLVTLLLALWTLVGLLVDAYFHSTDPGLESFWTPWHALFYSGFTATAAWLGWMALKRNDGTGNWLTWAPAGYSAALVGVAVFAAGGIGDAIWHTIFGVESSIDALLSPTHLLLFVGLLAILSAPLRAAWLTSTDTADGPAPSFGSFIVPLASLVFTATLVAFMLSYAWAPSELWLARIPFNPNETLLSAFLVSAVIITTLVMFVPLLVLRLRWRPPFGAGTFFLTFLTVAIAVGFDQDTLGVPAALIAGLTFDLLVKVGAPPRLITAVPPLVMWTALFAVVAATDDGLNTAPEVWGGAIVLSSMALLTVELLTGLGRHLPAPGAPGGEAASHHAAAAD